METRWISGALAALSLAVAAPALAGASEDFSGCDGLKKPKSSDDGMRGEATFPAFGFGSGIRGSAQGTRAACDRALASKNLKPEQSLRRAHLLRARAAAKIELGDAAGALVDLETAQQAAATYAGEFFYDRSMGVSIDLLRALALSQSGQTEAALTLAEQTAAKRPFSVEIQRVAALLRSLAANGPEDRSVWLALARIDPMTRGLAQRLSGGPAALNELADGAVPPTLDLPPPPSVERLIGQQNALTQYLDKWQGVIGDGLTRAYAHAANGQPETARAWLALTRKTLDEAEKPPTAQGAEGQPSLGIGLGGLLAADLRKSQLEPMARLIEARIALGEGRVAEAAALFGTDRLRATTASEEFHTAYAAARAGVSDAPDLPALIATPRRGADRIAALAGTLLIRPESKRKLIDYEKSRPNILGAMVGAAFSFGTTLLGGIDRTAGFRSATNADGSIKVEFTGNTTSAPVVQEMTLLRAAEIAREAGKSHFHIGARSDYEQVLTRSISGTPIERTLVGYKTELTIRLLDDGASEPDALDAVAVIDALGPVYYGN